MDKKTDITKKNYESPTLEITHVETEKTIAESGIFGVTLEDWHEDTDPPAPYDGDVWLNL